MANCIEVHARGYQEYVAETDKQRKAAKTIFSLFCGDKDETGHSWCPDCVKAEPIIREQLHYLPEGAIFLYCEVGGRDYWKNPNNEFKRILGITGVPCLLKVDTPQKLTEEECMNRELIRMLFTDE